MKTTIKRALGLALAVLLLITPCFTAVAEEAPLQVKDVAVAVNPDKTQYVLGCDFATDLDGLVLGVTYEDDSQKNLTFGVDFTLEDVVVTNKTTPAENEYFALGENTISVIFAQKEVTFTVTAVENKLEGISVTTLPTRVDYYAGHPHEIDREGLVISVKMTGETLTYDYSATKSNYFKGQYVSVRTDDYEFCTDKDGNNAYEISNFVEGKNTVTVEYMGKSASFEVNGNKNNISEIKVVKNPTRTEYVVGLDDEIILAGTEIEIKREDGTTALWKFDDNYSTEFEGYEINFIFDAFKVGENKVEVLFLNKKTEFTVMGIENPVRDIEIKALPKKLDYYAYFDKVLDLTGMKLTITYADGSTKEWAYDLDGYYYNDYVVNASYEGNDIKYGKNKVTVSYMGKTVTFDIMGGTGAVKPEPTVSLAGCAVSGITTQTYTGKPINLNIKITLGGVTLKEGTDYSVAYVGNVKVGNAVVRITGKGRYTGTILDTFVIRPKRVQISALTSKKSRRATVKWKKVAGATGYVIRYSNKSSFSSYTEKTVSSKKLSLAMKGLAKGKKIYVQVKAYKIKNEVTYTGVFSKKKAIKVK